MRNLYSPDSGGPEELTAAQVCERLQERIHERIDNQKFPQEFVDWQKCIRDRDETIFQLSAAVVTLCKIVTDLAADVKRIDEG